MGICRILFGLLALTLMAALGGCGWMSASGPDVRDILSGQRDPMSLNYATVKVTPKVIEVLSKNLPRLTTFAENRRPRDITFGVGDILEGDALGWEGQARGWGYRWCNSYGKVVVE